MVTITLRFPETPTECAWHSRVRTRDRVPHFQLTQYLSPPLLRRKYEQGMDVMLIATRSKRCSIEHIVAEAVGTQV